MKSWTPISGDCPTCPLHRLQAHAAIYSPRIKSQTLLMHTDPAIYICMHYVKREKET